MLVNQLAERSRGEGKHGSCGYGFGETVGRCEETPHRLTLADLPAPGLRARLEAIRDVWAPARLAALGTAAPGEEDRELLRSDALLERFLVDCEAFLDRVRLVPDAAIANVPALVFEGAQGLMLDQVHGAFPFVTRSNTGIANMVELAREAGIGRIEAVYVTRCYLTRHGRGPMPNEGDIGDAFAVADPTNVENPWQERLRFGELDLSALAGAIRRDLRLARPGDAAVVPYLATTCLDQARGDIPYRIGAQRARADGGTLLGLAAAAAGVRPGPASFGPTRATLNLAALLAPNRAIAA